MFEDTNKPPQPIEDIFSDTEVTPVPPAGAPPPPSRPSPIGPPPPPMMPSKPTFIPPPAPPGRGPSIPIHKPASNKGLIVGLVIVVVLGVLGATYWFWLKPWLANRDVAPQEEPVNIVEPPPAPDTAPIDNTPPPVSETQDTDGDRLNDSEEFAIGTDPNNPDTDNDGLFDGEEILIYQTNPLNSDTDGDGYLDGEEVRNNYNPNGPGRLLNLPDGELNFQELDNLLQNLNEETT